MIRRFFLSLDRAVYILFFICFFSVIGSLIIHFNPGGYYKIHISPLFKWLSEHSRIDTFWIYINILLFAYIGISTFFCLLNDVKRKNIVVALMHVSVIFFLIAHLISSFKTFRLNEQILVENHENSIKIPETNGAIRLKLKNLSYDLTDFGMPINIKALLELNGDKLEEIKINNPIKIGDYHIILKDITGYLDSIEVTLINNNNSEKLILKPNSSVNFYNLLIKIIDANYDFSNIKLLIEENKRVYMNTVKKGDYIIVNNTKFFIQNIRPIFLNAVVTDIVYDPSINIVFYSSTIFCLALIWQVIFKFKKNFSY